MEHSDYASGQIVGRGVHDMAGPLPRHNLRIPRLSHFWVPMLLALVFAGLPLGGAVANHGPVPYRSLPDLTITPTDQPRTWTGTTATGANAFYNFSTGEPCFDPRNPLSDPVRRRFCDIMLLRVDLSADPTFWQTHGGGMQIRLFDYRPDAASDFDLQIFRSDAAGTKGPLVGTSGNIPGRPESFTIAAAEGYYLVQVIYFAVVESTYTGEVRFVTRSRIPPDVDDPPGLQEFLASNPAVGFRSYSEPHIAQSPLDPNILVAGSKMYNKDPDSLPEYEFKIGTFVSFDGGQTWTQLGQLAVCSPDQAPPESWPNNTCYPEEDPNRDGTGPEDGTRGGGGDFAEEYITSDVWVQFDDEGNAYAMVLDAPPFPDGRGWGMSFHRWESVSPQDLVTNNTWSQRIPINFYPTALQGEVFRFADDKNTFAVNNAGPDGDGQTGIIVACWGQNIEELIKQQTVCERSTDGGRTWPGEPIPISGAEQLVIGIHVVADPNDPLRFYAVWLQYATGIVGAPDTMQFAQTFDGGVIWTPDIPIATLSGIPRQFPGQAFRNLSIPIMAAGPAGEIYVVYADYRTAPQPGDADGKQADIMIVRNLMGGLPGFWEAPVKVNQENTNADQFQPYVVVDPASNVEVSYFDRRHDPDNFFIDTYLSRSTDLGRTFTDTRLSHDMWDPTVNPPISPSGDFIGDYQGMVTEDCFTIPFVNDTHLFNDPARDPDFDGGLPRSEFQQVFSWRVPKVCPERVLIKVTGGGQFTGNSSVTFGLNVRRTTVGVSGHINVYDHGTGQHVQSASLSEVSRFGNEVLISGTCTVNGGSPLECEVRAIDRATPGTGQDEFHIRVGAAANPVYSAGGRLERGNIQVH